TGRVERRDVGGLFRQDYRLYVGNRNRTKLVAGMARQSAAVEGALGEIGAPVVQTLCFMHAEWSNFARPLLFGTVHVLWPGALRRMLRRGGPLDGMAIAQVERALSCALPRA